MPSFVKRSLNERADSDDVSVQSTNDPQDELEEPHHEWAAP